MVPVVETRGQIFFLCQYNKNTPQTVVLLHLLVVVLSPQSSPCPQVVPSDPWRSGILVHSALPVEPCTGLDDAPITDALRSVNNVHTRELIFDDLNL